MLVLVPGWLAQHRKGWVVLATETALLAAGITVSLAGFTSHQPLMSRVGVLITGLAVVFATLAVRAGIPECVRGRAAKPSARADVTASRSAGTRRAAPPADQLVIDKGLPGENTEAFFAGHIVQRLLALNATIWHNWQIGAPVKRSVIAYDHV